MTESCSRPSEIRHHHKGKSSADLLDASLILNQLSISPGQTVIDAGCGDGYMAKAFARQLNKTGMVYALDVDGESIAQPQAINNISNITFLQADITSRTTLPSSSADLLYLSLVIHGFSRDQFRGFQEEAQRLLKPDGILAIVEIVKKETPFGPPQDIRFSPEELQNALNFQPAATLDIGAYFYLQLFRQNNQRI